MSNENQIEVISDRNSSQTMILNEIPSYEKASPDIKNRIDAIISEINIEDVQSILSIGKEPLDKLAEVAKQIGDHSQSSFGEQMLQDLAESMKKVDFQRILDQGSLSLSKLSQTGGSLTDQFWGASLSSVSFLPVARDLKSKHEENLIKKAELAVSREINQEVAQQTIELNKIVDNIQQCLKKIPQQIKDIDDLGRARGVYHQDALISIAAAAELKRRVEEEIIIIRNEYNEIPTSTAQESLDNHIRANDILNRHHHNLVVSLTVNFQAALSLKNLKNNLTDTQVSITSHEMISVPQWRGLLTQLSTAKCVLALAVRNKEFNEFGNKLLDASNHLTQQVHEKTQNSLGVGTFDTNKVIESLRQSQQNLLENQAAYEKRAQEMKEKTEELVQACAEAYQVITEKALPTSNSVNKLSSPQTKKSGTYLGYKPS
jgi:uncharacterized protein YaaN involved in tellurite resistance